VQLHRPDGFGEGAQTILRGRLIEKTMNQQRTVVMNGGIGRDTPVSIS
jgi:hypothetical protein